MGRPRRGERKKFCMSIITRAVFGIEMVMGTVVVLRVRLGSGDGMVGDGGWVRSKPLVESYSQKELV